MTDNNQNPLQAAVEALQYGSTEDAMEKLYGAIQSVSAHNAGQSRIQQAGARGNAAVAKFVQLNERYADPDVQAAGRNIAIREQRDDLIDAGILDPEAFRKQYNRDPSPDEISRWFLEYTASGAPGLRTPDQILGVVGEQLEEKFGIKRRITDPDQNRKRAIREMQKSRGTSPWGSGISDDELPRSHPRSGDRPANEETLRDMAYEAFGGQENEDTNEAARMQNRRNAIAERMARNPTTRTVGETMQHGHPLSDDVRRARRRAG
jgi:hypothetical protein